jgi:uncharacterized protein
MDFERARRYALGRLEHELASELTYHSLGHTRDDVVPAIERLAQHAGIDPAQIRILSTAAYYHDLGFIERRHEHEEAGVQIAAAVLPEFGYPPDAIATITGMIRATRLPQSPRTPLEELLADADLDVLGRADFLQRNQALRDEMAAYGSVVNDVTWYHGQIEFLANHRYWSHSAKMLRNEGKQRNIELLHQILASHMAVRV